MLRTHFTHCQPGRLALTLPSGKGTVSESAKAGITKRSGIEVTEIEEHRMEVLVGSEMEVGRAGGGDPGSEGLGGVGVMTVNEKGREGWTEAKTDCPGIKRVPVAVQR